jgi:hypothetical protein
MRERSRNNQGEQIEESDARCQESVLSSDWIDYSGHARREQLQRTADEIVDEAL